MNFFRKKQDDEASVSETSVKSDSTAAASTGSKQENKSYIKRHVPFNTPVNPIKKPEFNLSQDQQQKYDHLVEYFNEYITKEIPVSDKAGSEKHPFLPEEIAWLTKECFLRYLRATKWKTDAAIKRIEETLVWRRSFGVVYIPDVTDPEIFITKEMVEVENETGKNLMIGYDNDNRPCLYLKNGYQNTNASIRQVQHLVFMLERIIHFMPPGQDTLALMTDFKAAPEHLKLSAKFPSISTSKMVLHILQHHYPERLGRGLFTNIPWIGYTFFKIVGPFIDPYTRLKTIYDQPFENFVPKEQLDKEFNGLLDFEYIHDVYWKEMNQMADRKHKKYMDNFEKLGGGIGLSEYDLRQGYDEE